MASLFTPRDEVVAQSVSASDLINAVNALRAFRGLSPYRVDSGLMSYAQQHAEYMASIQSATHTHSDGSIAWQSGIQENVASGMDGFITSDLVVNQIWSDNIHMRVMVDYSTGDVGAGVGLGSDGNLYFVLNVIASASTTNTNLTNSTQSVDQTTVEPVATTAAEWIIPLVKSTPNAEGKIIHVVANGQSLWDIAIAYEVTIDEIRLLNNLAMDSTVINIGQELLIMQVEVTPTVPEEETIPAPAEVTERPIATATSRIAATEVLSAIVTETPMQVVRQEELPQTKRNINFFHILITVSMVGLLFFSYFGFFRDKERSAEEKPNDN